MDCTDLLKTTNFQESSLLQYGPKTQSISGTCLLCELHPEFYHMKLERILDRESQGTNFNWEAKSNLF
jgi:hypothetical protein